LSRQVFGADVAIFDIDTGAVGHVDPASHARPDLRVAKRDIRGTNDANTVATGSGNLIVTKNLPVVRAR
jgi:hypothetical protein